MKIQFIIDTPSFECNNHMQFAFVCTKENSKLRKKANIILYMNSIYLFLFFFFASRILMCNTQVKTKHDLPCLLTYGNFCALCVPNKLSRMPFCTICN